MKNPSKPPLLRLYQALFYSLDGLKSCYKTEPAFRQELFLCIVFAPIPLLSNLTGVEQALMIFMLIQILIAELINSAIEAVVDRVSEEQHQLSKKAKDIGSAIVLVSLIACGLVWVLILKDLLLS